MKEKLADLKEELEPTTPDSDKQLKESSKLYIEGHFQVSSVTRVPAVRPYHRIMFKRRIRTGMVFYFSIEKYGSDWKSFKMRQQYYMQIELKKLFPVNSAKARNIWGHPVGQQGLVIVGRAVSIKKRIKEVESKKPNKGHG